MKFPPLSKKIRKPICVMLAAALLALSANQLQNANAAVTGGAKSGPTLKASVVDNELLVLLGHGFPAKTSVTIAATGSKSAPLQASTDATGRFGAMAFLSGSFSGTLTLKATAGGVSAVAKAKANVVGAAGNVPSANSQIPTMAVPAKGGGAKKPAVATTAPPAPVPATAATPAAATCKNATKSTSEARGSLDMGGQYEVRNEAWNDTHGPQTIYACSEQSWYVISNQTDHDGAVQTYPDSLYKVSGSRTVPQLKSVTSTFGEAYQAQGNWNAGYDIWLNDFSKEVMIWNEWNGGPGFWPTQAKTAVTLNGVPYHFLDNGGELMFFRDSQVKSGSVDILAALKWLVAQNKLTTTDKLSQIEYGVEICSTVDDQRFDTTAFTVNLS